MSGANSPFKTIQDVVNAAKKRVLNVAVSRIPTQTSIAVLALGDATGSRYNLIPYGGGNPTYIAVLNGEVDIGASPMIGVMTLMEKFKILGVFNRKQNLYADVSENAPTVNSVFGTDIPDLFTSRAWGVHTEWADKNPELFAMLERTARAGAQVGGVPRGLPQDRRRRPQPGLWRPQGLHRIRARRPSSWRSATSTCSPPSAGKRG